MIDYKCPICHAGNIDGDWYDSDHSEDKIIEYYYGCCMTCGKNFEWQRHYKFDHQTPFKED